MAQNQKFYKSRHTGKEIDDAIDSIGQIDKEMPTDIGLDENGKLILEHDGQEITGQKKTVDFNSKLDKAGGTITGNLNVQGNLKVDGTTTTVDTETLKVKDNVIVTNSDKADLLNLSGLAINVNASNTFGIMYNPNTNTVDLGLGSIDADGKFTYNANEGLPLVIRDLNNTFTQDHLISWSTDKNKIVDSGIDKSVINNKLDKFTEPSETSRIYLVSKSGAQAMGNVDFTATAYYIPRYSAQATLTTQTPQKDIDCTNKQYVDNAIAGVTVEVIDLSKGN